MSPAAMCARHLQRNRRALAVVLAAASALSCATNPVTGRREIVFMSAEREAELGRQAAAEVAQSIGLVEAPQLVAYVDAIGTRLAQYSPRRDVAYHFAVADMAEPNAFALPGGYIYVSRGLLAIANSEDELANVIGHEIGHVAARHAAQRETRAIGVGVLSVLGTVAAAAAGGAEAAQAVSQLGQVAGAGYIASYGRDQERQSDEVGQRLAAQAGWDPAGMARFLETLDRQVVLLTGERRLPTFLDSHPVTTERVATTARRAETLPIAGAQPVAATRRDFLAKLEGLLVGPDPAQGVFRDALFLHPGLGFAIRFPEGWTTQNQPTAIGAVSPAQDGAVALEIQGPAGDPREAAASFASANGLTLEATDASEIGGFPAYRARATAQARSGVLLLDLTWIRHPDGVFRIVGMAPRERFEAHRDALRRTATSFRALLRGERDGITERRLATVEARAGESLGELARRTQSAWSAEQLAVANALEPDARLRARQLLKIAREVPYRP